MWSSDRRRAYQIRQYLRRHLTRAEKLLWECLREEKLGCKIRRQHSIGKYIADFYCPLAKLVIEIDGGYHTRPEQQERDAERTAYFRALGFKVVRYRNEDVLNHLVDVVMDIKRQIQG